MSKKTLYIAFTLLATALLGSCGSSREVIYFQDLKPGQTNNIVSVSPIKLQPNDKVLIMVSTGDSRLNSLFNLPVARVSLGSGTGSSGGSTGSLSAQGGDGVAPYTIDRQGDIMFPVLGKLHIEGMTREELAEYIRRELISRDLAKNPIVTVEYLNLGVTVMGEISSPGRYAIDHEDYTILDALSAAGDLTIFGKRNNIMVLREEGGKQKVYAVNLNKGKELTQSPVYYLQQNDVIYVEPNGTKARQATPNGNNLLTPTFWMSTASFAVSMGLLIYNLTKN